MSICDKINTVGNTLETNLNARGVSCTFGTGSGEKNILQMANLITSSNLKGSADSMISISASRPYLLSGEKTDLIVTLKNGLGAPLANKSVTVSDGTSSYSGITNNLGLFVIPKLTVTATKTFTATYSTISDTCTVTVVDVFLDPGVTTDKSEDWYVRSTDTTLTVSVDYGGTTLSNSSTTTSVFYFANPGHSTSTSPPITMSDFVIDCDVVSTTYGSGTQVAFLLQGLTNNFNLSSYTAPYHIKMEKTGTTVKQYINDTLIRTTTISDRTNYYAGFQLYKNCSIKFKNYIIYEL